ncbi:MAG: superoxide dismutase family protein [Candidatus Hydrogenedentales bacterium]
MKRYIIGAAVAGCAAAVVAAVTFGNAPAVDADHHRAYGVAVMKGSEGHEDVMGTVTFTQAEGGVEVVAEFQNVPAGQHGFHIHEFGDLTAPDLSSAGGHFNPTNQPHSCSPTEERHIGDMGNIESDADGNAKLTHTFENMSLEGEHAIVGHAVILHAGEDDCESQPSGDAGGRIAGGVIGLGARR